MKIYSLIRYDVFATKYFYVLFLQIIFLLAYPYLEDTPLGRAILGASLAAIVIFTVYVSSRTKQQRMIAVVLAGLTVLLQSLYLWGQIRSVFYPLMISLSLLLSFTIGSILLYVLRKGPVTADKFEAAISAYIVIALLWAGLYTLVEMEIPGALANSVKPDAQLTVYDFLYFSFTTLTSTGYGDIIPVAAQARSLAILEQVIGMFYVAILIARLAGLYPRRDEETRP